MLQSGNSEDPANAFDDGAARRDRAPVKEIVLDPSLKAGEKLEEARRQLGLSLEEVSERIRVRREFLEALEAMNIKVLPGKAYALAFLRSYAKALGLDVAAIVEQFQDECALSREDAHQQIRAPESRPHPERPWLAAAALVLIAAGFVGYRAMQQHDSVISAESDGAALAPAASEDWAAGAPLGVQERRIEIRALEEAWLEARGPDGTVFLSRTLAPGDIYRPDPSPGWTLHARDGGAFEIYVGGAYGGLLGEAGKPVLGRQMDEIQPIAHAEALRPGG